MSCEFCSKPFDSIPITTTCGFLICKSHFDSTKETFECNLCDENHQINVQVCFNIPKNKKKIKEQELIEKRKELKQKIEEIEEIRKEPLNYLAESYQDILREIDLRREEVKYEINKIIDDYYFSLKSKIETDKQHNLENIRNILNNININKYQVEDELNQMKIKDLEFNIQKLNDNLKELNQIKKIIDEPKKVELKKNNQNNLNIEDYFGFIDLNIVNLKICENFEGNCIQTFQGHLKGVLQVIALEEINELVSCSYDCTIKVWNLETGECKRTLIGHSDCVDCIQVIDNQIISGSSDKSIKIWDKNSGVCLRILQGHSDSVSSLIVRSDQIISGSWDNTIRIWQKSTGKCLNILEGHSYLVGGLIYLNSNEFISSSKDIKIWNIEKGECIKTLQGHEYFIRCLSLINSNELASGSEDTTIRIWNLSTGDCIKILQGHTRWVFYLEVLENDQLVSGSYDKTIKIWNIKEAKVLKSIQTHSLVICLSILKNGQLITGLIDGSIIKLK